MDQQTQLEYFARAVQLLGGNTATARALDVNERTVRMFISGQRRLHAGILEDIGKALIDHADECRALERKLSPAFAGNRTEAQARPPLHDGRPRTLMEKLGKEVVRTNAAGKTPDCWLFSHSFYDRLVDEVGHLLDGREIYGVPWEATKDENLHDRGYVLQTVED